MPLDPFVPVEVGACLASASTCLGDLESEFVNSTMACGEEGGDC